MTPSVRSRLWASGTSFVLGFGLANYGILMIAKPDTWLWIITSVVLMLTGAAGVLFADTGRAVSFWAVLGLELFLVFTLVPLLWTFTLATTPAGVTPQTVLPQDISWSAFDGALHSDILRRAAGTSALVAGLATVISMPLAASAAYALVRLPVRGRRWAYAFVVGMLLVPVVALAGPFSGVLMSLDLFGSRLALVPPALVITLPLAIWLSVTVLRDVPWGLRDAVKADGANRRQVLQHFSLPVVAPGLVVVTLLVFVAGLNDFVLGSALAPDEGSLTLPATLLLASGQVDDSTSAIAAAGLLWLLPVVVLLLVFPRRVTQLLGRSYR